MLDGKQLRALFTQFNEQYFGGRLPAYAIQVARHITSLGEDGKCNRKRRLIKIRHGLSDEQAISTLLHEMAHAATSGHHSMPWKKEMIRLRQAGAPLDSGDLNIDLDDWDGIRVSRTRFRRFVQDVLINAPDITHSDVIRHFIHREGGAPTITAFLNKCPWAGTIFNHEKRAYGQYQKQKAELLATFRSQNAVKERSVETQRTQECGIPRDGGPS
jgi:hypothetical protein